MYNSYCVTLVSEVQLHKYLHQHHELFSLSAPLAHSLRTFFLTFPVLVLGNSAIISTSLGTMNLEILSFPLAHSMTPSPLSSFPSLMVMKAFGRSPQCESLTATTPASRISGCVTRTDSRATEEIFSPPGWLLDRA